MKRHWMNIWFFLLMLPLFSIKGKNYVHHIRNATPSDKIHEAITHFYDVPQHNALENKINFIAAAQTTQVPTQDLKHHKQAKHHLKEQ